MVIEFCVFIGHDFNTDSSPYFWKLPRFLLFICIVFKTEQQWKECKKSDRKSKINCLAKCLNCVRKKSEEMTFIVNKHIRQKKITQMSNKLDQPNTNLTHFTILLYFTLPVSSLHSFLFCLVLLVKPRELLY